MLRKLARNAIPYRSVREEFRASATSMRRAFRALRLEWFSGNRELKERRNIKLNVACGRLVREGWVNIDLYPAPGAWYVDVVNGLPFKTSSVTHIHCEHFLEHLRFDDAARFLGECHRVLVPDGTARVIVPDAEKYIRAYCEGNQAFFDKLVRLGYTDDDMVNPDLDTPIKVVNQAFQMGGEHKFAWDFATLSRTAREAGFSSVTKSCYGEVAGDLAIDGTDEWRLIESLYTMLRK